MKSCNVNKEKKIVNYGVRTKKAQHPKNVQLYNVGHL